MSSQPKIAKLRYNQGPVSGSHQEQWTTRPLPGLRPEPLSPARLPPDSSHPIQLPYVTMAFQEFSQLNSSLIRFYLQNKTQTPQHRDLLQQNGSVRFYTPVFLPQISYLTQLPISTYYTHSKRVCVFIQSCLILGDSMDCSSPGSSVHGILQATILEWVAMPSSRGSSQPNNWTCISYTAGGFFTPTEPPGKHTGQYSLPEYFIHFLASMPLHKLFPLPRMSFPIFSKFASKRQIPSVFSKAVKVAPPLWRSSDLPRVSHCFLWICFVISQMVTEGSNLC